MVRDGGTDLPRSGFNSFDLGVMGHQCICSPETTHVFVHSETMGFWSCDDETRV